LGKSAYWIAAEVCKAYGKISLMWVVKIVEDVYVVVVVVVVVVVMVVVITQKRIYSNSAGVNDHG
jgi:uncharacterized membrane protein YhaH (DUF805 family)